MEITYVNQKKMHLTYEYRIEIQVEFTYVNQKKMHLKHGNYICK